MCAAGWAGYTANGVVWWISTEGEAKGTTTNTPARGRTPHAQEYVMVEAEHNEYSDSLQAAANRIRVCTIAPTYFPEMTSGAA